MEKYEIKWTERAKRDLRKLYHFNIESFTSIESLIPDKIPVKINRIVPIPLQKNIYEPGKSPALTKKTEKQLAILFHSQKSLYEPGKNFCQHKKSVGIHGQKFFFSKNSVTLQEKPQP